ncbi:MAG: transporter substrate-binding domain-containing protein [Clostridia bacterium]|nr:transporter substrate-binding domain-containing protein [Clostridia bacterium]
MKKFLALLMAVLMLAALTACADKPVITVGYTIYDPMNFKNEDGELVGFDTDLAKAVFEKLGYQVVFKEIEWSQRYTELNSGSIDCIWNGFTANTSDNDGISRADKVDFSYNYMRNKQVIVTTAELSAAVTAKDSLSGKVGAVENGSAGDAFLTDELTGAIKNAVVSQLDAMKELALGNADFVVVDDQLAKAYVGKGDYANLVIVEAVAGTEEFYAIGFKKNSDLTAKVNETLDALAKDGTIAKIAATYGVSNTAITDFSDQK